MRFITIILLLVCLSTGLSLGGTSEIPINDNASTLKTLLGQYIESSSLQFSIYSYKPSLEGLADTLQAFGVQNIPSEFMSTLSVVFNHSSELDSRLEIGYWQAQLDTPPTAASLKATLVPISYQLIYRPVLLYQYIPIYLGAGFGTMRANFQGDIVDLLAEGGITLTNDATTTVGYVILGYELLQWKSHQTNRYTLGKNASVNIELKHILKTIETTGNQPINIVLDGTAIGISISSKF
ncbi:hypothetical protein F4225_02505 [Candidatus Poribacteria bacterium]|nr:hypothetical protein [Candidatus Poribacteria bacterium]